jgi:hypothetical protein
MSLLFLFSVYSLHYSVGSGATLRARHSGPSYTYPYNLLNGCAYDRMGASELAYCCLERTQERVAEASEATLH